MLISVDPAEVGVTGLIWLFLTYGYVLYTASNMISEGSDLLLLVPSMAGLVGGAVLPLLGAVPDGAIMLFSGLGDIETAQDTLSVGVGALAGSTIMLLTVPWSVAVISGRVNIVGKNSHKKADYTRRPKVDPSLSFGASLSRTGVTIAEEVQHGALIMMITTIPYFVIQIPTFFMEVNNVAREQHAWALSGLVICIVGFVSYLYLQLQMSYRGEHKLKVTNSIRKFIDMGLISLAGSLAEIIEKYEGPDYTMQRKDSYNSISSTTDGDIPDEVDFIIRELLHAPFNNYDKDHNGVLDKGEARLLFAELNHECDMESINTLFKMYDTDGDGYLSFDELVKAMYTSIKESLEDSPPPPPPRRGSGISSPANPAASFSPNGESVEERASTGTRIKSYIQDKSTQLEHKTDNSMDDDNSSEAEDIPNDIVHLPPAQQQSIIKRRAFGTLALGTILVVIFSDPMVDVMQEIANRLNLPPFYVSFILAPIASNASEFIASRYYALKKTSKSITVSLTALEGAASMNNTFCLSIFMGLLYFRGLAWQYTAETTAIVLVQFVVGIVASHKVMTYGTGLLVLSLFPLSILLVAVLEACGLD